MTAGSTTARCEGLDDFRKRAVQLDIAWEFRRWENGTVLSAEHLAFSCERLYGERTYAARRADLLTFAGSSSADADVVIGADGVHSIVRDSLFGVSPAAAYSGIPRTTGLQTVSHGRAHINHLPDGPEQETRDKAYAEQDPLVVNGWIYEYDADAVLGEAVAPR